MCRDNPIIFFELIIFCDVMVSCNSLVYYLLYYQIRMVTSKPYG